MRSRTQEVREWSAKPFYVGANPTATSNLINFRPGVETGKRSALKMLRGFSSCGFDSHPGHIL